MAQYINHITINTGHIARTSRADVADSVVAALSPWLAESIAADHAPDECSPIPGDLGLLYGIQPSILRGNGGGGLMVDIVAVAEPERPIITFGVATHGRQGKALWRGLLDCYELDYHRAAGIAMPAAPYCAVVLAPTLTHHLDVLAWAADFQRCIAWARLDPQKAAQ